MANLTADALRKRYPDAVRLPLAHGSNIYAARARAALAIREGTHFSAGGAISGRPLYQRNNGAREHIPCIGDWYKQDVRDWLRNRQLLGVFDYSISSYATALYLRVTERAMQIYSDAGPMGTPKGSSVDTDFDGRQWVVLDRESLIEWSNTTSHHMGQIWSVIYALRYIEGN